MIDDQTWQEAKRQLPFGARTQGSVVRHAGYGLFVRLPQFPDLFAVVDAGSYLPHGHMVSRANWPGRGEVIERLVVDHIEHHHAIKLRVEPG
ncbi:hypothetical protein [Streptomyces sp. NPDC048650]|uniref:hypothetical protein n=1 Tax=unclassified Streptomyces TaxID=2593676 RepID=UPI00371B45F2